MRSWPLVLVLAGCGFTPADPLVDEAPEDTEEAPDPSDTDPPDPNDTEAADTDDTEPPPAPDCSTIPAADADWELCATTATACEAVFSDGAGCTDVCAAAGLPCTAAYENRDGTCAPDLTRPALDCDSGHGSDFCVCGGTGTPTTTDPGVTFANRGEQLLAERWGFGAEAEGGDPTRLYRVTTLADEGAGSLRAALESDEPWYIVFDLSGTIRWEDDVDVRSNKTVDGRGVDILVDGSWKIDAHDVILSDLRLTRSLRDGEQACEQSGDVIGVRGDGGDDVADFATRDLWFHHLELFDGGDGLLDIRGGTHITISWSHFHTHKKATLAWRANDDVEAGGMRVTWHHNHFDRTSVRNPRFHYGWGHFVNNYVDRWWQYGVNAVDEAQFLSEGNIYEAANNCAGVPGVVPCVDPNPCGDDDDWFVDRKLGVAHDEDGNPEGYVKSVGDLALGGARIETNLDVLVFEAADHYSYPVDTANRALATRIASESGPRTAWTFP